MARGCRSTGWGWRPPGARPVSVGAGRFKFATANCRYHSVRKGPRSWPRGCRTGTWWWAAAAIAGLGLLTSCIPDATRYVDVPVTGNGVQNGSLGNCPVFPADNAWNRDVSTLPVATNSAQYLGGIAALGGNQKLHADFGGGGVYGIPYITVPGKQATVPVNFVDYGDESDPGP